MTPIVIVIYIIFEVELDNRKYSSNEDLLPGYTMSELYAETRLHVAKLYSTYWSYVAMGFYTGAVIFSVYYMGIEEGGVMFDNG